VSLLTFIVLEVRVLNVLNGPDFVQRQHSIMGGGDPATAVLPTIFWLKVIVLVLKK
jgi:nucleoside diphosphate kinase